MLSMKLPASSTAQMAASVHRKETTMAIGNNEEWGRADAACAGVGLQAVLLSSLADVTYVSG